ncbi:MAG: hypothetical protein QF888_07855, partial [Desulfobacterales bacterium]|nr:hypothetical protein [Desulfobacterales bacterium]
MPVQSLVIKLAFRASSVSVKACLDNDETEHCLKLSNVTPAETNYISYWILYRLKSTLLALPAKNVTVHCHMEQVDRNAELVYQSVYIFINKVFSATNKTITTHADTRGKAEQNENILFYTYQEDGRLIDFYEHWKTLYPKQLYLMTYPSGWNSLKRVWETNDYEFTAEDLLREISEKKIKKIVSTNYYVLESFMQKYSIFLPALLAHCGVEFIGVDADHAEFASNGLLIRALYTSPCIRLTAYPILNIYWDKKYDNRNIYYVPIIQHYEPAPSQVSPPERRPLLVLSHSRAWEVKSFLPFILYILDN